MAKRYYPTSIDFSQMPLIELCLLKYSVLILVVYFMIGVTLFSGTHLQPDWTLPMY